MDANKSQNIQAALAHIIGDLIQSIGVVIVSIILFFRPHWVILDPLLSISFSLIAISFSFPVLKDIIWVLMDSAPEEMNVEEFYDEISKIEFVEEIHDFHVWNLSFGKPNMTCHIICTEHPEYVLKRATVICRKIGIYHSTI